MSQEKHEGQGLATLPPFFSSAHTGNWRTLKNVSDLYSDERDPRTCCIVGSGPSLADFPFDQLNRPWIYTMAINDEMFKNSDKYKPDVWIFNDWNVLQRYMHHDVDPSVTIVSRQQNVEQAIKQSNVHKVMPTWLNRIHQYKTTRRWSKDDPGLYMHRTTAAPAVCLATRMGFMRIVLLGVDLFTENDRYYYEPGLKTPRKLPRRAQVQLEVDDEGNSRSYMEDRHMRMLLDMTHVKEVLDRNKWRGRIYQTSMKSPLSCYEKMAWQQVARNPVVVHS